MKQLNNQNRYVKRKSLYIEKARADALTDSLAQKVIGHYCSRTTIITQNDFRRKEILQRRCSDMAKTVHHGGKVGSAAKKLASNSTSKSTKSKAGTTLANHKARCH